MYKDPDVFDSVKHVEKDGVEHWSGRKTMSLLGYSRWSIFLRVIKKAQDACRNSGERISNHFAETITDSKQDFEVTRYGCYLIAQNGDAKKPQVAHAQRYFVLQTLMQESAKSRAVDQKRPEERHRLKSVEKVLNSTIYNRGITKSEQFARFKDAHIKALYGGKSTAKLKNQRRIPKKSALADFDSTVELAAKSLALAITNTNIQNKNLLGPKKLTREVKDTSASIRKSLIERGIVPEKLEPQEDIRKIEKQMHKITTNSLTKGKNIF